MKKLCVQLLAMVQLLVLTACAETSHDEVGEHPVNSIYHWKTTFALDSAETAFLKKHKVERIYVRMFDVAQEYDALNDRAEIVPIATTKFESSIPEGVEIVPTTYITLDALREMAGQEKEYATLLVERLCAMHSYNKCGKLKEVQFDCDWTASTRNTYERVCQVADSLLDNRTPAVDLSVTVRLHQLGETPPPADRGVLMLYNTGAIKNPDTRNSILDINDVKPYLKGGDYPMPLDYAYPAFGWGVKFKDGKFHSIVSDPDREKLAEGEEIRRERPTAAEIMAVKKLVEDKLGHPHSSNIIYHLDNSQLNHYSDNEIDEIFANS